MYPVGTVDPLTDTAENWVESASRLTSTPWRYLKVPQSEFKELQPADFAELLVLATRPRLA